MGLQYDTPAPYSTEAPRDSGWISRYAWGDDYHDVMGAMLERLAARLRAEAGAFTWKAYVDTGPIVERAYAVAAGLGAWGKNTCLLHPEHGSWFFLGELVTDLDLPADTPRTDMCGTCTACLEACPTGALPAPYVLDAARCISYLTIELKGAIPEDKRARASAATSSAATSARTCVPGTAGGAARVTRPSTARPGLVSPALEELGGLGAEAFAARFRRSPVKRARRRGLLRNVAVALGNSGDPAQRGVLERLARDEDPLVREHARWGLRRLEATSGPPGRAGQP